MPGVGVAATAIVGLIVIAGVVIGVQSFPDLRRYLQIRKM